MAETLRTILIVDDQPDVVEVLASYFAESGAYEIMTAHQGADAVMIAEFRRPDAVLLDILMPGMDGVAVLRVLRVMDPSIPAIMLTANADEKIARDTLTMGAYDYVRKPFRPSPERRGRGRVPVAAQGRDDSRFEIRKGDK